MYLVRRALRRSWRERERERERERGPSYLQFQPTAEHKEMSDRESKRESQGHREKERLNTFIPGVESMENVRVAPG